MSADQIRAAVAAVERAMPESLGIYLRAVVHGESYVDMRLPYSYPAARQRAYRARVAIMETLEVPRGHTARERRENSGRIDAAVRQALRP